MKTSDLREFNLDELMEKLNQARAEFFNLRFQLATGQLDNPMRLRKVRKEIARIQTVIREKELAGTVGKP